MSHSRFDPLDPTPPFMYDPCPTGDNEKNGCFGCIGSIISQSVILILCIICVLLTGCGSTKETSLIEKHRIETMMERMDSVINTRHVVQQDSTWRELVLHQFQSIREKSDTSHTVIVDTAGKVIRETIVINNVRETTSETDRHEREVMIHRLEVMDSTLSVIRHQLSHSDSLLQQKQTVIEKQVEKRLNWFQQARLWIGNAVLVALAVLAAVWIIRKRTWWIGLLRRI